MNTLQKLVEIRVMELREYVLPSIAEYIKNTYDMDISVEELATEALKLPIKESGNSNANTIPISSPTKGQSTSGCQFLMKNSRTRPNMPCGKSANGNKYFCKKCIEKASFSAIVKEVSIKLGISVEELTKDMGVVKKKEEGIAIRAPRVPEKRDKYTAGIDKQSSKKKEQIQEVIEEDQIELTTIPQMLDCFCYDDRTKIVYYFDDKDPDSQAVAFGFYKDDKIYPLAEQQKIEVRASGFEIGNYEDYELGDREVK